MKLYYPKELYDDDPKNRSSVFPLLKMFLKSDSLLEDPAKEVFGISGQDMRITESENEAKVFILPMSWRYYITNKKQKQAEKFIKLAESKNKIVCVFISGDFGVKIPDYKNVHVFRNSGYESKLPKNHFGLPVIIRDPLKRYFKSDEVLYRSYDSQPTVGFCGQAIGSQSNRVKELLLVISRNLRYYFGLSLSSPQKIQSTSFRRFNILKQIEASSNLKSNFIYRDQYGGGIKHGRGVTKIAEEYFENMNNSDYILCYRGAGNFSVRFFETLAMGRIPIYINTDGFLPASDRINWKEHIVWVEPFEVGRINNKILQFHEQLDDQKFKELQETNRKLWSAHLNLWSFFYEHFQGF